MTKLQISLTDEEGALLAEQAMLLGYDVTKYAKFVLAQKASDQIKFIPTYKATPKMERMVKRALSDYRAGRTKTWKFGEYEDRNK